MKMRHTVLAAALMTAGAAFAAPTYVGSFNVFDGPVWTSNPQAVSAVEAAALLFGGSASDYAISVDSSLDPSTITHTAWLDGWGDTTYLSTPASETFSLSSRGDGGYDQAPSFSAYVCDHANCQAYGYQVSSGWDGLNYTNYVWRVSGPVPEVETSLMLAGGLGLLAFVTRRQRRPQA
jgi:hypothetical protein